jgi:DNA replication and repair protein RecF
VQVFSVSALNFRSYDLLEINLKQGVTTLVGPNGQGKTNLIEVIDFSANLQSHRTTHNPTLIKSQKPHSQTRVGVEENNRKVWIETFIEEKKSLKVKVNSNLVKKHKDAVGLIKLTIFSPNDLYLIKGDPANRRNFLDEVLVQNQKNYFEIKSEYEKILKQKNALLKTFPKNSSNNSSFQTLEVWNEKLIETGSEIIFQRSNILQSLLKPFRDNYQQIAPKTKELNLTYKSNIENSNSDITEIKNNFLKVLNERQNEEIARGISLVGPQRDDFDIEINNLPAKSHSSQGESWSAALCLKLSMFDLLSVEHKPILILDDVFSELDQSRRELLINKIEKTDQTIITAAVDDDIPKNISGDRFFILNSEIKHG